MRTLLCSVLCLTALTTTASAAEYNCRGNFYKSIQLQLTLNGRTATAASAKGRCELVVDPNYRPTPKYAGYFRYNLAKGELNNPGCTSLLKENLNANLDSIKVSPQLIQGKDAGMVTFVIDTFDYHGQLLNEYAKCSSVN